MKPYAAIPGLTMPAEHTGPTPPKPHLRILGTRGIPAAHGGFETFAEHLALYLVRQGWRVTVYCQEDTGSGVTTDQWQGVDRVRIAVRTGGAAGTVLFDWLATRHAARTSDPCLTLGYNTAVFSALLRWRGVPNMINMDGIEWARAKWGPVAKIWFWLNERAGCWLGDHLIADHPEIKRHLATRTRADKITMIPYGADELHDVPPAALAPLGLEPGAYLSVIARPEPENSLLEIVKAFSARPRGVKLVVLGRYDDTNAYHRAVRAAAGPEVLFPGAIYDKACVHALRYHSLAYIHGHQVGGTNPSLVEALGAGNPVLAHDNPFNRWVAGPGARYFGDANELDVALTVCLGSPQHLSAMATASKERFRQALTWQSVMRQYETLLGSLARDVKASA
jgi:glycosyltransferase involved in cell wall biosynthesis